MGLKEQIHRAYQEDRNIRIIVCQDDGWFAASGYVDSIHPEYFIMIVDDRQKGIHFNELTGVYL